VPRVYQTTIMGEATVRAAVVTDRSKADLLVHRVSSWGLAKGDAYWYITRDKQEASVWVYFCSEGVASLNICFVDSYAEAGWQRRHHLKGRLG
jgi:hypothetical protein